MLIKQLSFHHATSLFYNKQITQKQKIDKKCRREVHKLPRSAKQKEIHSGETSDYQIQKMYAP
jgi:hypothetical protein